jgi:hypothetical protein
MVNKIVSHEQAREAAVHENVAKKPYAFRAAVLERAIDCTLGDRQNAYGPPSDALFLAAEFIRLYKSKAGDKYCAAHDEAIALACLKLARIACGATGHTDNYVDGAAYLAIAAECQHLYVPPIAAAEAWSKAASGLNPNRLAEVDAKYKAAVELQFEDAKDRDRGMVNPYAPVNKKV